jgi:hypothetical protein
VKGTDLQDHHTLIQELLLRITVHTGQVQRTTKVQIRIQEHILLLLQGILTTVTETAALQETATTVTGTVVQPEFQEVQVVQLVQAVQADLSVLAVQEVRVVQAAQAVLLLLPEEDNYT